MLGRKDYTKEELDHAKKAVTVQLAAFKKVARANAGETTGRKSTTPLLDFEAVYFNNMTLVLDRYFIHRIRPVTGKDGNPLNEVELIVESLMNNDGVFRSNKVIKYVAEKSVLNLEDGDTIRLTAKDFDRLSSAFLEDLERKFL